MAVESFAAASNIAVGRPRSSGGNQRPMALALAGKIGDSPIPSSMRDAKSVP
jgi:hypothetical protein